MKRYLILTLLFVFVFAGSFSAQTKRRPAVRKRPAPVITAPEADLDEPKTEDDFKPGPADADGWTLYESKNDLFKLAFPPTPVVTDSVDDYGAKDGSRYYNPEPVTPAKLSLTLTITTLGSGTADSDADFKRQLYNGWVEGVTGDDGSGRKTVKVSSKEFAFGDNFGLEVVVDREDFRFSGRIICSGHKCYQLAVGSASPAAVKVEETAEINKWREKFFGSFQLVKAASVPPDPFYGKTVGGIYSNDVLNFSLQPPDGWIAGDAAGEQAAAMGKARDLLKGDDARYNKLVDENLKAERMVLRYTRKPEGSAANASLGLSAQKLTPSRSNLAVNAEASRKMLLSAKLGPTVSPLQFKLWDKTRVATFEATTHFNGTEVKQRVYLLNYRGYGISIILTYFDEPDLAAMEKSVATLQFK